MRTLARSRAVAVVLAIALGLATAPATHAQVASRRVRVTLQPDCLRSGTETQCRLVIKDADGQVRLDFGPQIAIWIEKADGTYVDTVMVTQAVATLGIGNRPGYDNLPSALRFPYGKRPQALPVWAHARNKLYPMLVMQDAKESWLGFHEAVSSRELYFCRPLSTTEVQVDAVTCPSDRFTSAKGRFDPKGEQVYYPPRNDLASYETRDCDDTNTGNLSCKMSAKEFETLNDLDAVSTATPPYNKAYSVTWTVPDSLPDGAYRVRVEVSKEFDTNSTYNVKTTPAYQDPQLVDAGLKNNLGQPSVVWSVPFTLKGSEPFQTAVTNIVGHGAWDGKTGTVAVDLSTISDEPGSGRGRLLSLSQPGQNGGPSFEGKVHVAVSARVAASPPDGGTADSGSTPPEMCTHTPVQLSGLYLPNEATGSNSVLVTFTEPDEPTFALVEQYKVRYWNGSEQSAASFSSGYPVGAPARAPAGAAASFTIDRLLSEQTYTVGVQPQGGCVDGAITYQTFTTGVRRFTQLSGCFIATAAYGSPLAASVDALRSLRTRAAARSGYARALVDTYERSSPPVADALRGSNAARAAMRGVLAPLVELAKTLETARALAP